MLSFQVRAHTRGAESPSPRLCDLAFFLSEQRQQRALDRRPGSRLPSSRDHSIGASASGAPSDFSLAPALFRAPLGISAHDADRKTNSLCKAGITQRLGCGITEIPDR